MEIKTIQALNEIKNEYTSKINMLTGADFTGCKYKRQVLVCGGTGCTSSGSPKLINILNERLAEKGVADEVEVTMTGCFGLCALGPIMIVYPEGTFYSRVEADTLDEIIDSHIIGGTPVEKYLYREESDGNALRRICRQLRTA